MFNYAQINGNGIAVGISQLSGQVDHPDLIPIDEMDHSLLGKRWTGSAWETVPEPETPEPSEPLPTELEKQVTAIKADLELIKALTIQDAAPPSDVPDMPPMPSGMDMPEMPLVP